MHDVRHDNGWTSQVTGSPPLANQEIQTEINLKMLDRVT